MPKVTQSYRETGYDVEQSQYLEPQPSNWSQQARQWLKGGVMLMGGLTLGGVALTAGRELLSRKQEDLSIDEKGLIAAGEVNVEGSDVAVRFREEVQRTQVVQPMSRSLLSIEEDKSILNDADTLVNKKNSHILLKRSVPTEVQVNEHSDMSSAIPAIAVLSNGDFVITWTGLYPDDSTSVDIYWKGYHSDGTVFSGEQQVNTISEDQQDFPAISGLDNGGFVITWRSGKYPGGGISRGQSIYRRIYNSGGTPQEENDCLVYSNTDADPRAPAVASVGGHIFVITWTNIYSDTEYKIYREAYWNEGVNYKPAAS